MGQQFTKVAVGGSTASVPMRPLLTPGTGGGPAPLASVRGHTDPVEEAKQVAVWRAELTGYYGELVELAVAEDPDQLMAWLAGVSARVAEMRAQTWELKIGPAAQLRDRSIDPFSREIDRQFAIASRRLAFMEWEGRMTRGYT